MEAAFAGRGLAFVRQDPPLGTGHARAGRARASSPRIPTARCWSSTATCRCCAPETLAALARRPPRAAAPRPRSSPCVLDDPGAYGRVAARRRRAACARSWRPGTRRADERGSREINAGIYAFEVRRAARGAGRAAAAERAGRVLPDRRGRAAARRAASRWRAVRGRRSRARRSGVNTLAELAEAARAAARSGAREALMAAGRRHRGSRHHPRRPRRGGGGRTPCIRPFTILEGRTVVRAGAQRRARSRAWWTREVGAGRADPRPLPAAGVRGGGGRRRSGPSPTSGPRAASAPGPRSATSSSSRRRTSGDGLQGAAPLVPRRRHDRARASTSAPAPSPATTTAPHKHPTRIEAGRLHRQRHHAGGAGHGRRGRLRRRRAARSPRTCPRARWPWAARGRWSSRAGRPSGKRRAAAAERTRRRRWRKAHRKD